MVKQPEQARKFYGSTTLGEKGQMVVPAEARESLKLKKGDKFLVFGFGDMVAFTKIQHMEKFADHLENRLKNIRKIIRKSK